MAGGGGGFRRIGAALAAGGLLVGFGGGFLTAKAVPGGGGTPGFAASAPGGFGWPFFGKPRGAGAKRGGDLKPEGFAVWTTRLDTSKAAPLACVRMTRPLDAQRSYADFVMVAPDLGHPVAATVSGDELCLAGLGFAQHQVTLLKGFPSASGETLADNVDVDFAQGEKPPYVGFAGDGVILPREEADGVGIETLNVTRLKMEVWRVADRNLVRKEIATSDPTEEGGYAEDSDTDDSGRKVWEGEMPVAGKPGQRATTVFPLGAVLKELKPGAYVVKAADASGTRGGKALKDTPDGDTPAQARRWILFTDMALQAYDGSDALDVTVRGLKSAKAMSGVRVALVAKDGEDLAAAQSDKDGRVRFDRALLDGDGAAKAKMVMAYGPQGDFTAMDLDRSPVDLSSKDVGGRELPSALKGKAGAATTTVDGFLYADRGIYRPGETVHLVAMVRDRLARAVADRAGALVIRRPSGLEYGRVKFATSPGGVVTDDLVLPRTAPRGRWRATLEMEGGDGASSGEASFQVEDFAPQRLAVTIAADANRPIAAGETRRIDVLARFLYGAEGAGLAVQGEARFKADPDPFPAFKDYRWGDEQKPFAEKQVDLAATTTDGSGRASELLDTSSVADALAPLTASVNASVFEPGGRPVTEQAKLKLRTKPLYLGVKSTSSGGGDTPTSTFEVIAVDANGRRVAAPAVNYLLIAETWSYDWFEENGRWSWRRTNRDKPLAKGVMNVAAGAPARFTKRLAWGDYRMEVEDPATGARTVIREASGWGEPAQGAEAPDTARVSAGDKPYASGDTVEVRIQAPYAGEAQVAVATDRLIELKSVSVPAGGTTVRFKTSADWAGGAYVLVSVVQPRDPQVTPKPRRALGLVYVPLEPKGRKLSVDITAPPKLDSKAAVTVPLQVKGLKFGARAHVTVAAVDEGILRLTHAANPDPVDWYFGKRSLSLSYRDDYGRLLDPNLGAPGQVNFGGDEVGGAGLTATPIKTVALWSGVVETGADGRATVKLPAADFNGQLRLVAVAWTDDQLGSGVSDMIVRQPVVADLALPRFLAPGDHAFATLELHDVEGKVGAYVAELFGRNGVLAPFRKLYDLIVGQRIADHAEITAPERASIGGVGLHVSGPGFDTRKDYPIETRLGWGPITRAVVELQRPGETYTPPSALLAGLAPGGLGMTVSYSPFRGFDPAPIADALGRYPYGCSEQLVSTAFPLLYAVELGRDPKLKRSPAALTSAVIKLLDRESLDGAFGLWRAGDEEADPWLGAYIVDFLLEARSHGAAVPDDALARALHAMQLVSKPDGYSSVGYRMSLPPTWGHTPAETQALTKRMRSRSSAYALYVLAKAQKGDLGRLRWFHDVQFKDEPSPLARAQVGAGLAAMGDKARAHDSFVQAAAALGYKEPTDWYQSPLRDTAAVIALAYEAGEVGIARSLQARLEDSVKNPDALNTQEQARLLQAAHAMLAASGPVRVTAVGARPLDGGARWAVGRLADARFTNGGGAVWRTVTVHGTPLAAPAASGAGLRLAKSVTDMHGAAVDLATLPQGARVVVRLAGASQQDRSTLTVVDDALPAGWEIESTLGPEDSSKTGAFQFLGELSSASVQEKRDDRYIAALTVPGAKPFTLAYIARAVTPGDFLLPGAEARDMYRPTVAAHTAAGRVKIVPR